MVMIECRRRRRCTASHQGETTLSREGRPPEIGELGYFGVIVRRHPQLVTDSKTKGNNSSEWATRTETYSVE